MSLTHDPVPTARSRSWIGQLILAALVLGSANLAARDNSDVTAETRLAQARKAAEDKDYAAAAKQYRDFLTAFPQDPQAEAARWELALALLEKPNCDYAAALGQLKLLAAKKNPDLQPALLFYQGAAVRGLALMDIAGIAKPAEAAPRRAAAYQRLEEASSKFAAAADAFARRIKGLPKMDAAGWLEAERSACARCAQLESDLRRGKAKDAQAAAAAFLKDASFSSSRYRDQALYYHGLASYRLGDYFAAGRSLNLIATFAEQDFGSHAQYLLARVHELTDERAEALGHYQAVVANWEAQKNQATEALKQPDKFQNNPAELARLEALAKAAPPEMVVRARFRLGLLHYEAGRLADAQALFAEVSEQSVGGPCRSEAQLLMGICAVGLEQYGAAIKILRQALEQPDLEATAHFWLGKAQAAAADPEDADRFHLELDRAENALRRALEKYSARATTDAETVAWNKSRAGETLLEIADVHRRAGRYKEAAAVLTLIAKDNLLAVRTEEVLQRRLTALNLAGIHSEAHRACVEFQRIYPNSTLMPEVLFRRAESGYFLGVNAEPNARVPGPAQAAALQELARWHEETTRHYRLVMDKYPEASQANLARFALAALHYRKGELDKTVEVLDQIPAPDRNGELAEAPYLQADCLIRLAPTQADDALLAGRLNQNLSQAVELLAAFTSEHPDHPLVPDALLRLGICQQRLAELQTKPEDRKAALVTARSNVERLLLDYPLSDLAPLAALERARCLAQTADDPNEAMARLRSFAAEPLRKQSIAPLAILQWATLLRGQDNKAAEAAQVLARCRQHHEKALLKDPERTTWAPLLAYHHGVALKEAGRFTEARAAFEGVIQQHPRLPLAKEAALRKAQTVGAEAWDTITKAQQALAAQDIKPDAAAAANQAIEEAWKALAQNNRYLETQAEQLQQKDPKSEVRARTLYELAWSYRAFVDREIEIVRAKMQQDLQKQLQDKAAKDTPEGQPVPTVPPPDVPLDKIALQPAEKGARRAYQSLIAAFPDSPLANAARLELGELHIDRGDVATAQKVFNEALDKEPPAELTSRLHLRLGALLSAQGNHKAAMVHFDGVSRNPDDPLAGQGHYRAAECLIRLNDLNAAVQRLALFRDNEKFQNVGNVSDLALLRLGQVLLQLKRWEESRQTLEQLFARFGGSGWVREGVFAVGWAWHNEKQYDNAVARYQQAAADQGDEVAARSLLLIGVIELERQKYAEAATCFQAIADKFGSSDFSALALLEAAHAHTKLKQPAEAGKLLQRVANDFAGTPWAALAKEWSKKPDSKAFHNLPAATALLTPAPANIPALETLGQYVDDRVALDDPGRALLWSLILARTPSRGQSPFSWQKQTLPDPFENRRPVLFKDSASALEVQTPELLRLP